MTFFKSNTVSKLGTASLVMTVLALAALACPELAFAQDAGWVEPAVGIVNDIQAGAVRVVQGLILISVVIYAARTIMTGQFDIQRGMTIIGGAILGIGAVEMVGSLLGLT